MEELTYFEALTYVQSGIVISVNGTIMTEERVNNIFFLKDDDETIRFKIHS